jgi:hypothetical protein
MDLFDTLTWGEILIKTSFLGTPTLTVPSNSYLQTHDFTLLWYDIILHACNTIAYIK